MPAASRAGRIDVSIRDSDCRSSQRHPPFLSSAPDSASVGDGVGLEVGSEVGGEPGGLRSGEKVFGLAAPDDRLLMTLEVAQRCLTEEEADDHEDFLVLGELDAHGVCVALTTEVDRCDHGLDHADR